MNNTTPLVDMMTADTQVNELVEGLALLWGENCAEQIQALAELHRCMQTEAMAEFAAGGHTLH